MQDIRERYGRQLAIFGQLEVTTTDGHHVSYQTDNTWKAGTGHILSSDPKFGEHVGLLISSAAWLGGAEAGTENSRWGTVNVMLLPSAKLVAESVERVQSIKRLPAKIVSGAPSGKQIVDLDQNFAGWVKIKLRGSSGTRILLTYNEVLTKDGELDTSYICPPLKLSPQQDSVLLLYGESWAETWFTVY
ncbi:hypothetical protein B0J12DRAFT_94335 [Macrophomina phaseolina]|uniref:Uncharacterized protein n=1 Tax=Macrophomina phaseolina TaxID=35725 RepID=A0ABQ8GB77_9PEZI|nr:hypothetical protein B0J12DRAFT_94335 [Macrophomina phaseolina]